MKSLPVQIYLPFSLMLGMLAGGCSGHNLYEDTTLSLNRPVLVHESDENGSTSDVQFKEADECIGQIMPGLPGNMPGNDFNYRLGCSLNRAVIAQIADPSHALGRAGLPDEQISATRASALVKGRDGTAEPSPFVPGYILSETGSTSE